MKSWPQVVCSTYLAVLLFAGSIPATSSYLKNPVFVCDITVVESGIEGRERGQNFLSGVLSVEEVFFLIADEELKTARAAELHCLYLDISFVLCKWRVGTGLQCASSILQSLFLGIHKCVGDYESGVSKNKTRKRDFFSFMLYWFQYCERIVYISIL